MTDRIESPPAGEIQALVERAMALANAATKNWRIREHPNNADQFFVQADRLSPDHPYDIEVLGEDRHDDLYPPKQARADADFIIASRQLIPELCEAITRLSQPSGEEIREAAAKIAREFPVMVLQMWDRPGGHPGNGYRPSTFADVAAAILAMPLPLSSGSNKSDEGKKGQTG